MFCVQALLGTLHWAQKGLKDAKSDRGLWA